MNTYITEYNWKESAENLDSIRLMNQIEDGISILAAITDLSDHIMFKRKVKKDNQAAKLWIDYEQDLINYLESHLLEVIRRGFKPDSQIADFRFLTHEIAIYPMVIQPIPRWVTPELVITHRSCLIQEYEEHYKKLWPNVPKDKIMKYDWREDGKM